MRRLTKVPVILSVFAVMIAGIVTQSFAKTVNIGCVVYKFDDTFMTAMRVQIQASAKEIGATVDLVDGQNSEATVNDKVDLFITKKVDSLAINPVDRTAAGVILEKAKKANIPIVFFNREPLKEDMAKWDRIYYVGAKAEQSGIIEGQLVIDYFKAHPTKDGVIHYVMLKGEPGHQDAELRTKFSTNTIIAAGFKMVKLAEDTAMWDRVKGQDKMASFIASLGDKIDVVIANNDDMALGAIEALKAAGYFKNGKYMPVVGVDATSAGIAALQDGTMLGTVLNDAKNQGKATFMLSYVLAMGQAPTEKNTGYKISDGKYVWIEYKKITKDNISEAK